MSLVDPLGGQNIVLRRRLAARDALDRLLAGFVALVVPFFLSSWLLHVELAPATVEDRIRLTLVPAAAPSRTQLRQPAPPAAPEIFEMSTGNRKAAPDRGPAVPKLGSAMSASIEPDALKLGLPQISLPLVASTTLRNITGTKQSPEIGAKPRVRLLLGDGSFFGGLLEAQRSGECADLVNRLRSSQGGPSMNVILESLKRRGCSM